MKAIFLIFMIVASALAQTNAAKTIPPAKSVTPTVAEVQAGLATISNRLEQVEATAIKSMEQQSSENKRLNLERSAGKLDDKSFSAKTTKVREKYDLLFSAIEKQRTELKLQDFNIRQRYNIPEPAKKKRVKP